MPFGQSAQYFSFGGTVDLNLRYRLGGLPIFLFGGSVYTFAPAQSGDSISVAAGKIGGGVQMPLSRSLLLEAYGAGGYYYATLNEFSVSSANPYADGGLGLEISFSPSWSLGIGALYRSYFGLYQGISAGIGTRFALGVQDRSTQSGGKPTTAMPPALQPQPLDATSSPAADGGKGSLRFEKIDFVPVFPVFYKYYDDHPIGSVAVKNNTSTPISNLSAAVYIKRYMDNPKKVNIEGDLGAGGSKTLDLYALFTDKVLSITEGTKASAEITLDYTMGGKPYREKRIETVRFLDRNAMTWDDNRRAAAFVTAKDPAVLTFAKSTIGLIRSKEVRSLNSSLQTALGLHEALDLFGLNYVTDPTTPYVEFSRKKDAADFLQFPRQTLQYKAGDCDDLSILYGSLLEAVGIKAAFVTTPGHIFIAVDTGLSPKQAADALIPADRFIVYAGKAWIPVEITLRHEGFLKAWEQGAKAWNEANPLGRAGFYPIEEAWRAYEPVGLPGSGGDIAVPSSEKILSAYRLEVTKYIDQAIFPQVAKLQSRIRSSGSTAAMNKLGVLYAKYGQPKKAELEFKQILERKGDYLPAILNLGNLAYLNEDWLNAQQYYGRASELAPRNAHVLLAVARVNQELQNYGNVRRSYEKLKALNPTLAQQYAYLALGSRAGGARSADVAGLRKEVVWEEE